MQMTDAEICLSYQRAESRPKQIGILAELNQCTRKEIKAILCSGGYRADELQEHKYTWTPEQLQEIQRLRACNISNCEIALRFGIATSTLADVIRRYGLNGNTPKKRRRKARCTEPQKDAPT